MNLAERLKALIETKTSATRRYKELEEMTAIPAGTWKTFYARGVRPSADLIEGIAKRFPQYSEWLLTGEVKGNGQLDPNRKYPIDLSTLDDPYTPTNDEFKDEPTLSPEEIEKIVATMFSQLSKRKRKKNGNQES